MELKDFLVAFSLCMVICFSVMYAFFFASLIALGPAATVVYGAYRMWSL